MIQQQAFALGGGLAALASQPANSTQQPMVQLVGVGGSATVVGREGLEALKAAIEHALALPEPGK